MLGRCGDNGVYLEEEYTEKDGSIREMCLFPSTDKTREKQVIYYVARNNDKGFRSAGIVADFYGINNLFNWADGEDWNPAGLIEGKSDRLKEEKPTILARVKAFFGV